MKSENHCNDCGKAIPDLEEYCQDCFLDHFVIEEITEFSGEIECIACPRGCDQWEGDLDTRYYRTYAGVVCENCLDKFIPDVLRDAADRAAEIE